MHARMAVDRARGEELPSFGSRLAAGELGLVPLAESELAPMLWVVKEW